MVEKYKITIVDSNKGDSVGVYAIHAESYWIITVSHAGRSSLIIKSEDKVGGELEEAVLQLIKELDGLRKFAESEAVITTEVE